MPLFAQEHMGSPVLEKLASPRDEHLAGTLINSSSVHEFQNLIPHELRSLVEAGELSFSAFRSWRISGALLDEQWIKEGQGLATLTPELLATNGMPRAFPFGSFEKISQQPVLSQAQRIEQMLWNSQAASASRFSYSAEFLWSEESAVRNLAFRGALQRVIPRKLRPDDRTKQLFRERITLTAPKSLQGLSWLTFRFVDDAEDVVWSYAPAIKKVRQLVGTNRSDPFLGSAAAVDDLLGFSTKIQLAHGAALAEDLLLAPVYALDVLPLKSDEPGCFSFIPESKTKDLSNRNAPSLTPKTADEPSLQLSALMFVPRSLIRLELMQGDPYALGGREVLYLDRELFIPFYKVSYDRAGSIRKLVITPYAAVQSPQGQVRTWVPSATYVYEVKTKSLATISYQKVRFCEQADSTATLAAFDPKAMIPVVAEPIKKPVIIDQVPVLHLAPAATPTTAEHSTSGE